MIANSEPGFLGSTSYNAVLAESEDQIAIAADVGSGSTPVVSNTLSQMIQIRNQSRRLKDAVTVLEALQDFDNLERIVIRWGVKDYLSVIRSFSIRSCKVIRSDIIDAGALQSDRSLVAMAEQLLENTSKPIHISKSSKFKDYLQFYSGSNIRWEVLGCFFTACGLGCDMSSCDVTELDFVGHKEEDRQHLMYRLLELGNICVSLCEEMGTMSDLGMWVMLENCIYASQVLGDSHYLVWRKVG